MNYQKVYDKIIKHFRSQTLGDDIYIEKHHIVPRSFGGSDDPSNLVALTARAHFICHLLLVKMHTGEKRQKMAYALYMLANVGKHKATSRQYSMSRQAFITANAQKQAEMVEKGVHNFCGSTLQRQRLNEGNHHFLDSELQSKNGRKGGQKSCAIQLQNGTHVFLGGEIQRASSQRRVKEGSHNWLGPESNIQSWKNPETKKLRSEGISRSKRFNAAKRRIQEGRARPGDLELVANGNVK